MSSSSFRVFFRNSFPSPSLCHDSDAKEDDVDGDRDDDDVDDDDENVDDEDDAGDDDDDDEAQCTDV